MFDPSCFSGKKQTNQSNLLAIEVMIIPHINIKNPLKSENWRMKNQKNKLPIIHSFNSKSLFHKTSYEQEYFKLCKSTVVTKTSNVKCTFFFSVFFFFLNFAVEKSSAPKWEKGTL